MIRDLIMRCSSIGVCVPSIVMKCAPRTSPGSAAYVAGNRTLMTYCEPLGMSSFSKQ